ncbi:unnamed protein product [Lactuca virosa]|uniref:Protein kinase domain-containing protein n=1 Tax=Lactuca virosa TaxID=75947 RepID=A0AAU9P287_9ASTR|nr:unnamed protein product [Lactuca virosa]
MILLKKNNEAKQLLLLFCVLLLKVVTVLARLTHPNIISLLGYSNDKEGECLVVYEYMQNQNLDHFLFGDARDVSKQRSWGARLKIMIGVACGLAYMHSSENEVIHRDVNTYNILLDQDFNAKLGGFELSRFGPEIQKTYVSRHFMGTLAYVDPWGRGNGHAKSDIYSFGIIMLEILTGKHALNMKRSTFELLADKSELKKLMDPRLERNYPVEEAFQCAVLALKCIAMDREDRPSSEEVLRILEQIYVNK